jgi:dephospho-CoA kinase
MTNRDYLKIALTGGIATGKSEVAKILRKYGAAVISADQIGKEVMEANPELLSWIRTTFGEEYLLPSGELDRKKFGNLVFSQPDKKKLLDEKIFPLIHKKIDEMVEAISQDYYVVVVDAALIFEWGIEREFDLILTVTAPTTVVYERLHLRDGFENEQVKNRIASQLPSEEKIQRSHWVLNNDGSIQDLKNQVYRFWQVKVEPFIEE